MTSSFSYLENLKANTRNDTAKLAAISCDTLQTAEGRAKLEDADASATRMRLLNVQKDENRRRLDLQQPLSSQEFSKCYQTRDLL